jgi:sterol desaturase/sphingolipid hydroxylase (fatty acid hydroxylase superfamily)
MIDFFSHSFANVHTWLFEAVVQPIIFALGWANESETAFNGTEIFLLGALEIAFIYALLRPLEKIFPAEKSHTPKYNVDVVYTFLHRLGGFSLLAFFALDPIINMVASSLHLEGIKPLQLDAWLPQIQSWSSFQAIASFLIYLIVLDFVDYCLHRAQHQFNWWWGLHSLHHSQRAMTLWSDDRNHILDSLLHGFVMALVALAIGVPPAQFIGLIAISRILQSLQHANIRAHFGWLDYFLVSPRFHRLHHAIGVGHETAGSGTLGGHNFAVLLPIWDVLFGTAKFGQGFMPTGVRNQLSESNPHGCDYGQGFWRQQYLGLKRMVEKT